MHVRTHRQSDRQIDSVTRHYEVMHVTHAMCANTTSQMLLHTHMRYYRHYCTFLDPVTGDRPPENPYELAATLTLQIRALRLRLRTTYYQYMLRRYFDLRFDPTAFVSLCHCTYALTGSQTDRYDSQIVSRAPMTSHASHAQHAPLQRHMHSHMCI